MSSPTLPHAWPQHAMDALLHAIALARTALAHTHAGFALSPLSHVRLRTQLDRLKTENLQLKEQLRIKDARMARLPPRKRPHYPPVERLAILALRAATGWSTAETARVFQVCPQTIAEWTSTVRTGGEQSLVTTPEPVNRFPEQVAVLVQSLRATLPTMGRRQVAQTLARAGLHLSASTVRRMQEHSGNRRPPAGRHRSAAATPPLDKPKAPRTVIAATPTTSGPWTSL